MIMGNVLHTLRFAIEAQQDWVVPIPDQDLKDMAKYLSAKPSGTYPEYIQDRYESSKLIA